MYIVVYLKVGGVQLTRCVRLPDRGVVGNFYNSDSSSGSSVNNRSSSKKAVTVVFLVVVVTVQR